MTLLSAEKTIKLQARQTLKNGYVAALASFGLLLIVFMFVDTLLTLNGLVYISLDEIFLQDSILSTIMYILARSVLTIIAFLTILLLSPFYNGYVKLFYCSAINNSFDIQHLTYFFQKGRYGKTLKLNLAYFVRMIIPTIVASLPVFTYVIICALIDDNYAKTGWFYYFFGVLLFLSFIGLSVYVIKYFVVFTKYSVDDDMKIKDYFKYSKSVMSGKSNEVIKLTVSFIPWFLLSLLALPLIYVVPYYTESLCISAKWLCELKKEV